MSRTVQRSVHLRAPRDRVWHVLTDVSWMERWKSDHGTRVTADWRIGGTLTFEGVLHELAYRDIATVLAFEPPRLLRYSFHSGMSERPETPGERTIVEMTLAEADGGTSLTVTHSNIRDEVDFGHTDFYWRGTLHALKQLIEAP